jgi:GR25 family glycosyltransferase involved in LPS biosynthesis
MALDIRNSPTYVINLDRRPDRWVEFQKQPLLQEFTQLRRFSAVDGSKLDVTNDERISLHTRVNIAKKYRRSHYEINTPGAIGASLSHLTIWKHFLASDAAYCVVFEDDTLVRQEDLDKIDQLVPKLPEGGWDMWLLGTHRWAFSGAPLIAENKKSWWSVDGFTGAHAYVLSRRGAEILLEKPFPIETHIEYYITGCAKMKDLRILRHWALRMTYAAEEKEEIDSDTFDNRKSCPVCYVPDNMLQDGFYMSYHSLYRMMVGLTAVGFVGYGWWLGKQRRG